MTVVTGIVKDITGLDDKAAWAFGTLLRESDDGTEIITPKWSSVRPVDGVITVDLDPGYAKIKFLGVEYEVTIPDSGPVDLWDLIAIAIHIPPNTPLQDLIAALEIYFLTHSVNAHNVRTFGALGNGSHDDTSAIQAAFNAATSSLGSVLIPSGNYKITSKLTLPEGVSLRAAGPLSKITTASAITMLEVGSDSDTWPGVGKIEGLILDGTGHATAGLMLTPYVVSGNLESITIRNIAGTGLTLDGTQNTKFTLVDTDGCTIGKRVLNGASTNSFDKCEFASCGTKGIVYDLDPSLPGYALGLYAGGVGAGQSNKSDTCIVEYGTVTEHLDIVSGLNNTFDNCVFSGFGNATANNLIKLGAAALNTHFQKPQLSGDATLELAVLNAGSLTTLTEPFVNITSRGAGVAVSTSSHILVERPNWNGATIAYTGVGNPVSEVQVIPWPYQTYGPTSLRPYFGVNCSPFWYYDTDLRHAVQWNGSAWQDDSPAVDIRRYITSGTTFDISAVRDAMEKGNGACYIPPGDWTPDEFNVHLDDTLVVGSGTAVSRNTYHFFGSGKQSRILLPAGMVDGDFLFNANSDSDNDYGAFPKVIFEDLSVSGTLSPSGSFYKGFQRSVEGRRLYFSSFLHGFKTSGYSDAIKLQKILCNAMTTGSWVVQGTANGDACVFDQIIAYGSGAVKMSNCFGMTIRNCLSSFYYLTNCDFTLLDNHIEGDGSVSTSPIFTLRGCTGNVFSGYYEARKYRPTFSIDDVSGALTTKVIFHEGVRLAQRIDDTSSEYGAAKAIDVDIVNMSTQSELTFKSPRSYLFGTSTAKALGAGGTLMLVPKVTASGMSAIQTVLDASPLKVGKDYTIRYSSSGAWQFVANDRHPAAIRALTQTSLSVSATTSSYFASDITSGTYYYKAWATDVAGRESLISAEGSATFTGTNLAALTFNVADAPLILNIVRGVTSGSYSRYAKILVAAKSQTIYDQGTYIAGTQWSASIPTIPSTAGTFTGHVYDNGNAEVRSSASPTVGFWLAGDRCWNSAPVSGPPGWLCTVQGTPGTWVPMTATLATARTIDGQSFDGSANITVIAPGTHAATNKATPVDADEFPVVDTAASNVLKKTLWSDIKAALKTYFDSLTTTFTNKTMSGASNTFSNISADSTIDGTTNKVYTATEKTKLAAISGTNTGDQTSVTGNAGTATALATSRNINQVAFNGTADITVGSDLPCTQWRVATNRFSAVSATNGCVYQRVRGSGTITKIGLWVKASSGNLSVAIYSNSGVGSSAVPSTRVATSGTVACPAIGYAEISLGGSVTVKEGDWMAISADNVTATFAAPLNDGGAANDLGKGMQCFQATAHPAPSSAATLTAAVGYDIALKGIV